MNVPWKPGYKTTEFLITLATGLALLISALSGNLSPHWAAIAGSVASGLYAISRGLAKLTQPTVTPGTVPTPPA